MVPPSLTYADAAASGVSNSGNNQVNYQAPNHPAFSSVFAPASGASALVSEMGAPLVVALGVAALVALYAFTRSNNHGK